MIYDPQNIFAKIIRGELPCVKVWEREDMLCIMDAFPEYPGHCLVMPKVQAITLNDLDVSVWVDLMSSVYTTAQAVSSAFPDCGVALMQLNGSLAGQTVSHVHVHIIPRQLDKPGKDHGKIAVPPETLQKHAHKIKLALGLNTSSS